jgi:hypothetical protein
MTKYNITLIMQSVLLSSVYFLQIPPGAQSDKEKDLIEDCNTAKAEFIKSDELLSKLFDGAAGYVMFPNVGKGAVGVGGHPEWYCL